MQHFDGEAREAIIQFTLERGSEDTPWQDDCLSTKKALPGFQLRPWIRSVCSMLKHPG